jgi:hypothetical protein
MKNEPNKAMEPRRVAVTDRAYARSAPATRLAHLWRSAKNKPCSRIAQPKYLPKHMAGVH